MNDVGMEGLKSLITVFFYDKISNHSGIYFKLSREPYHVRLSTAESYIRRP